MNIPKSTGPRDLLITKLAVPPENVTVGTSRIAKSIPDFKSNYKVHLSFGRSFQLGMCITSFLQPVTVHGYLKEFQKGNRVTFLTPVVMLWGGGHIGHHAWRRVIVPSDLA